MAFVHPNTEFAILSRIIVPHKAGLPTEAATAILSLQFASEDIARMDELADKARRGTLTSDERDELDEYERAGHLLSLLHSKARISLRAAAGTA